jgi:sulfur carrier protein ThiS
MAQNITVTRFSAQPQVMSGDTPADLARQLSLDTAELSVSVNGETVDMDYELSDYEFVSFGKKVKGGVRTYDI